MNIRNGLAVGIVGVLGLVGTAAAQTYTRVETITYKDDLSAWILGQVERTTASGVVAGRVYAEREVSRTEFTARMQPYRTFSYGNPAPDQTFDYHPDGTVSSVRDGRGNATTLNSWKRGIPQYIRYADGTGQSATVNDDGTIANVTDEAGNRTCYQYDAMGRLSRITYPSKITPGACDTSEWYQTTHTFTQVAAAEYGLPAGHWKQVVSTGNARKVVYFDALWRPVVEETYDAATVTSTRSVSVTRYDVGGRVAFASYPVASVAAFTDGLSGVRTTYDALDRPTLVEQDSEFGPLPTTTSYLSDASGPYTLVKDPRGHQTRTWFQAFDQPSTQYPVVISQPEGVVTEIARDVFSKPVEIVRRSTGNAVRVSRTYAYDAYQRLCRSQEPETGATLMGYDAAGNLAWSAAGLPLGTNCDNTGSAAVVVARKVGRTYDARNRLRTLTFPDGNGNQSWLYHADGKPREVTTYNDGGATSVINSYVYNNRGLVTGETQKHDIYTWSVGYGYDPHGNRASMSYPGNLVVTFAPDALGRPTSITGSGATYASGVSYYPNGSIRQFTYGNGIVHTMQQNARQLPARVTSSGAVLDDEYAYDANGNVDYILDRRAGNGYSLRNRWMTYDGLNRLTGTGAGMFGGTDNWHRFTYDALDNITSWKLAGGKDYADYYYEPATNRLLNIRNSGGSAVVGLGYDVQGNLAAKNGQTYTFDFGNRLRVALGTESYRYDAHGRRVLTQSGNGKSFALYGVEGPILWERDERVGARLEYVYLGGSLLATRRRAIGSDTGEVLYYHTDALGSNVAVTNPARTVVQETEYEPYGAQINRPINNRPAYTGHVSDAPTGLVYMQQRYYDPQTGRFLSVDPVTAYENPIGAFNRYWYAGNNPYKFVDPDGREIKFAANAPKDFLTNVARAIRYLNSANVATPVGLVKLRPEVVTVKPAADRSNAALSNYDPKTKTITWADMGGVEFLNPVTGDMDSISPAIALGHEFEHAINHLESPGSNLLDANTYDSVYDTQEERNVIEGWEQPAAESLGEGQRQHHSGQLKEFECSTPKCE